MSNNHSLRRPQPGEPLRVLVLARDASGKNALAASIAAMGRTAQVEDRETHAHVAIIDVSTLPTQTLILGQPVDAARQRLVRHALDESLAAMNDLSIPTLVLVQDEAQARAAVSKGARGAVKKSDAQRVKAALDGVAAGLSVVDFALVQNKASLSRASPDANKRSLSCSCKASRIAESPSASASVSTPRSST